MHLYTNDTACPNGKQAQIPIGLIKSERATLLTSASRDAIVRYSSSPDSIAAFLIWYAAESGLPDPGLQKALTVDLLSALIATCIINIYYRGNTPNKKNDINPDAFDYCKLIFWQPIQTFSKNIIYTLMLSTNNLCDSLGLRSNDEKQAVFSLFMKSEQAYYEMFKRVGIEKREAKSLIGELLFGKSNKVEPVERKN